MNTALVVVDMLNRYEHEDADALRRSVAAVVPNVRRLLDCAREAGHDVVYVNDNHGDWTSGREGLTQWALDGADPSLVEPVAPTPDVPLLIKTRHSAFYRTQLEELLQEREVQRIVFAGQVTEQCILYSVLDAYMRGFDVVVAEDAVAHIHEDFADTSLRMMKRNMGAVVEPVDAVAERLRG